MTLEVIVGNIGSVYRGHDETRARMHYNEYVDQSKSGRGRAGNELVTLFINGEEKESYEPASEKEEK
jgi:hypothetical protein